MDRFNFKKKYGQNFLTDINLVKKIVSIANIEENSLTIEVGPGKGILSKQLLEISTNVLLYEIDIELKDSLERELNIYQNKYIIYDDFLKRNINNDIKNYSYNNVYFVSNVPYYITTPILMKLIDSKINFKKIVLMVQEELGERICAKPGTRNYGSLTVLLSYYYEIRKEFKVSRKMFVPKPNVDSIVISMSLKNQKSFVKNEEHFFKLVRDCFQYKRKNIRNNLKQYDLNIVEVVLKNSGYKLSDRAEQLPMEIFVKISNALN